jgi:hypothetical protein
MGYAELYANGYVELGVAVAVAVLIMVLVLVILWAHGEAEARAQLDHEAWMRAMEAEHRAKVYGAGDEGQ